MFMILDDTRTLETKYKLMDPAAITNSRLYTIYGSYAICAKLQEEHGKLISDSDWPALAQKLPKLNTLPVETPNEMPKPNGDQNIQCNRCKQYGHKANNPICPLYDKTKKESANTPSRQKPKDPWKYVEPKDLSQPVIVDGKQWFFCTKCKCRVTGKVGFYQLSHMDETHDPNWRPEGNNTPVQDPDPTPNPPLRPPSNPSPNLNDDLVFTGVHHTPVLPLMNSHDEREMPRRTSERV